MAVYTNPSTMNPQDILNKIHDLRNLGISIHSFDDRYARVAIEKCEPGKRPGYIMMNFPLSQPVSEIITQINEIRANKN